MRRELRARGVAIAALSALVGPIWHYVDPFSTLFDVGAWVVRRLGIAYLAEQTYLNPHPKELMLRNHV